jgi:hypothetical protein
MARVVVTEEESERIDEQWAMETGRHDIYLAEKQAKVTEKQERETIRQTLFERFRKKPSPGDIEWSFLNSQLVNAMKQNDWNSVGLTYRKQAELLEKEGLDSTRVRQESIKALKKAMHAVLLNYKKSGVVNRVEILTAGEDSCSACRALEGKIYTISQALKENPLPVANCTGRYGYCRCVYAPVV